MPRTFESLGPRIGSINAAASDRLLTSLREAGLFEIREASRASTGDLYRISYLIGARRANIIIDRAMMETDTKCSNVVRVIRETVTQVQDWTDGLGAIR